MDGHEDQHHRSGDRSYRDVRRPPARRQGGARSVCTDQRQGVESETLPLRRVATGASEGATGAGRLQAGGAGHRRRVERVRRHLLRW